MNGKTWHASFPLPWHSAHSHLALLSSNQTSTTILHIFIHSAIRSLARVKIDCCPSVRGRQSLYSRGGSLSVTLYPESESRKLVWSCLRRNKIATRRCRGLLRGQLEHKRSSAGFLSPARRLPSLLLHSVRTERRVCPSQQARDTEQMRQGRWVGNSFPCSVPNCR